MTFLSEAYLRSGELARSRDLASRGLHITRDAKYWYGVGWAEWLLGRIALAAGDLAEVDGNLREALRIFESVGARFMMGRTHLSLAELGQRQMDRDAGTAHLGAALEQFRALRLPMYVERAELLAREFRVRGSPDDVSA